MRSWLFDTTAWGDAWRFAGAVAVRRRQDYRSVSPETKMLKGFEKIELGPGEEMAVSFAVTPRMLSFVGLDMKRTTEDGTFTLRVGAGEEEMQATLELRTTP